MKEVEAFGEKLFVKSFTVGQREKWEHFVNSPKPTQVRENLVIQTCCDAEGKLLFTDADIPSLSEVDSVDLDKVFKAAVEVCGLRPEKVDEAEKNSESAERP